jgi:hypothetical protein
VILITFVTSGSDFRPQFSIEFEGLGKNVNKDVEYRHFHFKNTSGVLSNENLEASKPEKIKSLSITGNKKRVFKTVVLNPDHNNVTELHFKVESSLSKLNSDDCSKSSIAMYDDIGSDESTSGGYR